MTIDRLLAKSWDESPTSEPPTIAWHTKHVLDSASRLLRLRGKDAIEAMGLPHFAIPVLERIVRFAAWLHDVGKCMLGFQQIVRHKNAQYPFRHEAASWYIARNILDDFIAVYVPDETERWMMAACAAGHHRTFRVNDDKVIHDPLGESELLLNHADFHEWIKLIPIDQPVQKLPSFTNEPLSARCLHNTMAESYLAWDEGQFPVLNDNQKKILSLAKSFLIAADVSASALSKDGITLDWIEKQLEERASSDNLKTLLRKKLGDNQLRNFQKKLRDTETRWTLIIAGCGTGKTAAACAWAAKNHQGRQLWLTYPTTGTATEGYRDYVQNAALEGSLIHSKAIFDLGKLPEDPDENELPQRELALRGWGADVVVATVDTVLGIMQNQRAGYYAYPGIVKGAIVFDEIHAYDDHLFANLLRFLDAHPGIPCLLMTASLQDYRKKLLNELHEKHFNEKINIISGPEDLEQIPRYYRSMEDPWATIEHCKQEGGKVLWVSNNVDQCMAIAHKAMGKGIEKPLCYHSRYRYLDRIERHKDIIEAFNEPNKFVFACTTQVAEMSLDISADLLITDLAPIPAMIQRLGRLNRKAKKDSPAKPFIVILGDNKRDNAPYKIKDLDYAKEWLNKLLTNPISQQDLVHNWTTQSEENIEEKIKSIISYWLDESLWTQKSSLRDASPGITVILDEDIKNRDKNKPISLYQINMPPRKTVGMKQFRLGLWVAAKNQICYNNLEGASWQKK
jgi:CRISPR-associated endonuclease/helicase Cas3